MNAKTFFILLILLIFLAVAGMGLGFRGDAASMPASPASWVKTLDRALVRQQRLLPSDILFAAPSACETLLKRERLTLPAGGQCAFYIDQASANVRTLPLYCAAGLVQVTFLPGEKDRLTMRKTLTSAKSALRLNIFEKGGKLTLACLSPETCEIRVGK